MKFYLDGQEIDSTRAHMLLIVRAELTGYAQEDWQSAWDAKETSEEARDMLTEISDYRMEFISGN